MSMTEAKPLLIVYGHVIMISECDLAIRNSGAGWPKVGVLQPPLIGRRTVGPGEECVRIANRGWMRSRDRRCVSRPTPATCPNHPLAFKPIVLPALHGSLGSRSENKVGISGVSLDELPSGPARAGLGGG